MTDRNIIYMSKVQIPAGKPAGRITCPHCGNVKDFVEIASNVLVTSRYVQNRDGSFSPIENETEFTGDVRLFCGQCSADVSEFHAHFQEMIF